MHQASLELATQIGSVMSVGLMSKRTATRLALVIAALMALLASLPVFAQPLRSSAFLEWGGSGVLYGLGIEHELARPQHLDLWARLGASAFPVLLGRGRLATLSGHLVAVVRSDEGRVGLESAAGLTALATHRLTVWNASPLDTLVTMPTVGLALRMEPAAGERMGGRAGVIAMLFHNLGAVLLPTLGITWALSSSPPQNASPIVPPRAAVGHRFCGHVPSVR